jgi:hypothetical protein
MQPAPSTSGAELSSRTDNTGRALRPSFRPAAVDPVGVLASASELSEALLLTVVTAVTASAADFGLVHRARAGAAITVGGHGPFTEPRAAATASSPNRNAARSAATSLGA